MKDLTDLGWALNMLAQLSLSNTACKLSLSWKDRLCVFRRPAEKTWHTNTYNYVDHNAINAWCAKLNEKTSQCKVRGNPFAKHCQQMLRKWCNDTVFAVQCEGQAVLLPIQLNVTLFHCLLKRRQRPEHCLHTLTHTQRNKLREWNNVYTRT